MNLLKLTKILAVARLSRFASALYRCAARADQQQAAELGRYEAKAGAGEDLARIGQASCRC